MIGVDSISAVECAGRVRGHFPMGRGARQGRPAYGFFFTMVTMVFDPIIRWLRDAVIPKDPALPAFLQPTPCASADDFCVRRSFFQGAIASQGLAVGPSFAKLNRNVTSRD